MSHESISFTKIATRQRGKWLQKTPLWSSSLTTSHRRSSRYIVSSTLTHTRSLFLLHTHYKKIVDLCICAFSFFVCVPGAVCLFGSFLCLLQVHQLVIHCALVFVFIPPSLSPHHHFFFLSLACLALDIAILFHI